MCVSSVNFDPCWLLSFGPYSAFSLRSDESGFHRSLVYNCKLYTLESKRHTWSRYYYAWCINLYRFTSALPNNNFAPFPTSYHCLPCYWDNSCQPVGYFEWTQNERSTYQHCQQWTDVFHWLLCLRSSSSGLNRLCRRASRRERWQRRRHSAIASRMLSSRKRTHHFRRYRTTCSRRRIRWKRRSSVWRFRSVGVRCGRGVRWVWYTLRRVGGSTGRHDRRWAVVWRCRRSSGRSRCDRRDIHIADFVQKLYITVSILWKKGHDSEVLTCCTRRACSRRSSVTEAGAGGASWYLPGDGPLGGPP